MPKFRRRPAPKYDENDSITDVTTRDDAATELLQSRGLDVRRVTRTGDSLLVEWRRTPTEAERNVAEQDLPGAAHAHP